MNSILKGWTLLRWTGVWTDGQTYGHTAWKQYLPRKGETKLFGKPKEYQKHSQKVMLKSINICQYILKFYYKRGV